AGCMEQRNSAQAGGTRGVLPLCASKCSGTYQQKRSAHEGGLREALVVPDPSWPIAIKRGPDREAGGVGETRKGRPLEACGNSRFAAMGRIPMVLQELPSPVFDILRQQYRPFPTQILAPHG